ncbi:unnamed protein product [Moneuplotes crassus]|uniref:Lipase n=1 Tax=Euplotes crassus TaxID=5936 RepID=A0AAD1UIW1_EUPCR|nr:unnamed protein product [Moneuplotes crassus]
MGAAYGGYKLGEHYIVDPEAKMDVVERCRKYGFKAEKYFVETDDHYILQVFRLIPETELPNPIKKPSLILQHGFDDSCFCWVSHKEKSPAFLLANKGYDVWMNNSRGNIFSRLHRYLDPEADPEFWDYSLEEMGMVDSKAVIKHVKQQTGHDKVTFVGQSQGSAQMFYALSRDSEWFREHLNLFVALAPVTRVSRDSFPFYQKLIKRKSLLRFLDWLEMTDLYNKDTVLMNMAYLLARVWPGFVNKAQRFIHDGVPEVNDHESVLRFWYRHQGGNSYKNLMHWKQVLQKERFVRFDYGEKINMIKYGTPSPPDIDLTRIHSVPIALFCGNYDVISSKFDVDWTKSKLSKDCLVFHQNYDYGHISFNCAKDMSYIDDLCKLIDAHQ